MVRALGKAESVRFNGDRPEAESSSKDNNLRFSKFTKIFLEMALLLFAFLTVLSMARQLDSQSFTNLNSFSAMNSAACPAIIPKA
jgi:hypothetical protein